MSTLNDLALGSRVGLGKYVTTSGTAQKLVWEVAHKTADKITLVLYQIPDVLAFDAMESNNTDVNARQYGNNSYRLSNIRHYLNRKTGGYVSQHQYDSPPTSANTGTGGRAYDTIPGFLQNFADEEIALMLDTNITLTEPSTPSSTTGSTVQITDKVFLLSKAELSNTTGFDYYKTSATAYPAKSKTSEYGGTAPTAYWTRDFNITYGKFVDTIFTSGSGSSYSNPNNCYGIICAVNVSPSNPVNYVSTGYGYYEMTYTVNYAPTINIADASLGSLTEPPSITFQVNDVNTDNTLTITEELLNSSGTVIQTIDTIHGAVRSQNYTIPMYKIWDTVALGSNYKVRITVTDNLGKSATQTSTFNKVAYPTTTSVSISDFNTSYIGDIVETQDVTYKVAGDGRVEITEYIDGVQVGYVVITGASQTVPISRTITINSKLVDSLKGYAEGNHKVTVHIGCTNTSYPSGQFITRNAWFNIIPRPDASNYQPTYYIPKYTFGNSISGFVLNWTISDDNVGDSMSTVLYLDNKEIYSTSWINDESKTKNLSFDLSLIWGSIPVGTHKIEMNFSDGFGTYIPNDYITFTKINDKLLVYAYGPPVDKMPKRILSLANIYKILGASDTYTISACNNALDSQPAWEDITSHVLDRTPYTFANLTKTNSQWRIGVKVESFKP
jgi:hypothetical protein